MRHKLVEMNPTMWGVALAALALAACGSGGEGEEGAACDPGSEFCGEIPGSASACTDSRYWPLAARSGTRPLVVHYSRHSDAEKAREVLAILESSWEIQVDAVGFAAPLPDGGQCGPDNHYDVFLWRGLDGAFVESIADYPATAHDDVTSYIAINPFVPVDRQFVDTTLAHEFNHALQASDDWWESAAIFEMTATYAEALVFPDQDDWFFTIEDFQARPEWSLFYDDGYQTWYMYGAAMFLHFLEQRYYDGDASFVARIWRESRSEPAIGHPDYIDAMRLVLMTDLGITLDDAVLEFMQWRWFVAEFDDGQHFDQAAEWPQAVDHQELDAAVSRTIDLEAMLYGAQYLRLVNRGSFDRQLALDLSAPGPDATWLLTTVTGNEIAGGVTVPADGELVIVATAIPSADVSAETLDFEFRRASLELRPL